MKKQNGVCQSFHLQKAKSLIKPFLRVDKLSSMTNYKIITFHKILRGFCFFTFLISFDTHTAITFSLYPELHYVIHLQVDFCQVVWQLKVMQWQFLKKVSFRGMNWLRNFLPKIPTLKSSLFDPTPGRVWSVYVLVSSSGRKSLATYIHVLEPCFRRKLEISRREREKTINRGNKCYLQHSKVLKKLCTFWVLRANNRWVKTACIISQECILPLICCTGGETIGQVTILSRTFPKTSLV